MPTGLYKPLDLDTETNRFTPQQNKTLGFKCMVTSCFQRTKQGCKIESFYKPGREKKIDCFSVDGVCSHRNAVFEAMDCFNHFCLYQEVRQNLTE